MSKRDHLLSLARQVNVELTLLDYMPESLARQGYKQSGGFVPRNITEPQWFGDRYWDPGQAVVYGFSPQSREDYWVAMHELGHGAIGSVRGIPMRAHEIVADEARAWLWALGQSKEPMTRSIATKLFRTPRDNFHSYLDAYGGHDLPDVQVLFATVEHLVAESELAVSA